MSTRKLSKLLLAGALIFSAGLPIANHVIAASQAEGSALPPGVNPSSPAGGNGGEAQGMEKKPVNPSPPGSEKKTKPIKHSTQHPSVHKKTEHKKKASPSNEATSRQPSQ